MNREPFSVGEWYHCYSRGIDKRVVFQEKADYSRFLELLYLANSHETLHRSNLGKTSNVFTIARPSTLVDIGAFCLMPNHFHLLIREISKGSITTFMRKLGTGYTMYFNIKNERTGGLFAKPFRSKHIQDDGYFQRALQYIHCNPAELYQPRWKEGRVDNMKKLHDQLLSYPYSSLGTFERHDTHNGIISSLVFEIETQLPTRKMIEEARAYYKEIGKVSP